MNRIGTFLTLCLLAALCQLIGATTSQADEKVGGESRRVGRARPSEARLSEARRAATDRRREWLRKQLTAELRDKNQIVQLNTQLDGLDDQQVDIAAVRLLEQLDKRRSRDAMRRAVKDLARAREMRDTLRRMAAARHGATASPAGFFPVITVLPQGASLTASAVVSPDRRHVRITVNPFFSSIGPVDTFNFFTGETRRPLEFNPQLREPPPVVPRYDGLRTRSDRNLRR
ncbi:MAG: hypothetical protein QGH33_17260 [Pirellulaceae bacterium]|jgi:hypothetical protein|nr:hypothetical protein [Pirellulaceae bacterium]MDP7302557.1 hypothetical protein [Pirellulaceae bacterium]HJN08393.1 hypothetical protein [Pirellulaceae bacterium]